MMLLLLIYHSFENVKNNFLDRYTTIKFLVLVVFLVFSFFRLFIFETSSYEHSWSNHGGVAMVGNYRLLYLGFQKYLRSVSETQE